MGGDGPGFQDGAAAARPADRQPGRIDVLGLPCSDVTLECAARHLVECAAARRPQRVAFVNAHTLNVSVRDPHLRQALRDSDVIYADGVGMAMAARLQRRKLRNNVNGTDLFPLLCREAARRQIPIALFGAAPGVIEQCRSAVEARHPGLEVAWSHHGYVHSSADTDRVIDEINGSGARILLVAMGVPRQERWIAEHASRLQVPVVMGVGGLFDFTSGRVPRAPQSLRRLRLEWLFRLMVEPRRLFVRYALGNPLFLARAMRYAVTGHLGHSASDEVASR